MEEALCKAEPLFCYEVNQLGQALSDSLQYLVVLQLLSMLKALIEHQCLASFMQ